MHAHAHLTRPRLQTQCSTPARLEVNLAFGDFDFVVEVELHFERALFRNLALHGNCALGRSVVLVYVLLVDVDGHDHVCRSAPICTQGNTPPSRQSEQRRGASLRTGSRGSLVHRLRPPAPAPESLLWIHKDKIDRRGLEIVGNLWLPGQPPFLFSVADILQAREGKGQRPLLAR